MRNNINCKFYMCLASTDSVLSNIVIVSVNHIPKNNQFLAIIIQQETINRLLTINQYYCSIKYGILLTWQVQQQVHTSLCIKLIPIPINP